jgi:hypothetical protein
MSNYNEQQLAALQAVAEVAADLGPAFTLEAVAVALEQMGRTEVGGRGDNLSQAVNILRQLADVLSD